MSLKMNLFLNKLKNVNFKYNNKAFLQISNKNKRSFMIKL